nr:hypothetical protein [Mycobacterium avium]
MRTAVGDGADGTRQVPIDRQILVTEPKRTGMVPHLFAVSDGPPASGQTEWRLGLL